MDLARQRYWIKSTDLAILVFDATQDCGYIRTYRYTGGGTYGSSTADQTDWVRVKDEDALYELLNTPGAKAVFAAWNDHKTMVTALPTEFVTGRLKNTTVEKAIILSKGDGCVVCGVKATCYAATTMGDTAALMVQLPVCEEHLASAKSHPTIFSFLVSLFQLNLDWQDVVRHDSLPDSLIPTVHALVATELGATVGAVDRRDRGWHLWLHLPSGWQWLLRLNSLADYAYVLLDPQGKERYRADSAPDHRDVPFFPMHQHSQPSSKKKDDVTPSFLYGHPLLDFKRLKSAGEEYGASLANPNQ